MIFSFSIIYCSSIVNYFTITFLSPVPASRVIIAEETPDLFFWSKYTDTRNCRQGCSCQLTSQRYLISQKIKSGNNLWKSWKDHNDSSQQPGLTLVLTPKIIRLNHYLWDFSFSDHATGSDVAFPKKNSCYNLNEKLSGLRLMVSKSGAVLSFQVCVQPGPNPQSAPGPFWNRKWFNCGEYFSPRYKICFTFRTSHILFSCVSVQYFLYDEDEDTSIHSG